MFFLWGNSSYAAEALLITGNFLLFPVVKEDK